jgi:hypothetical protein
MPNSLVVPIHRALIGCPPRTFQSPHFDLVHHAARRYRTSFRTTRNGIPRSLHQSSKGIMGTLPMWESRTRPSESVTSSQAPELRE